MKKITIPYNFTPRPYQLDVFKAFDRGIKRHVLVWHRRAGKDLLAFNLAVREMLKSKSSCFYFFPTYAQGRKVIWDSITKDGFGFRDFIPKECVLDESDTSMKIVFKNGSFIQIVGSDNVDALVGTSPKLCVFSEYALQNQKVWSLMSPILAENGGAAIFVFTPRGLNHAWELLKHAEHSKEWYSSILTVDDTNVIPGQVLAEERGQMPADLFQQEYYCKFVQTESQVFRNVMDIVRQGDKPVRPEPGKRYVIGVDIAKRKDFTVMTPIDLTNFAVGTPRALSMESYVYQEVYMEREHILWNRALLRVDTTGVGEPVCDQLETRVRNIDRYYFTEQSREALLQNLKFAIESGKISLPNHKELIDQLMAFQYVIVGSYGKTRMEVPSNMHDDYVMSLALAVWDLPKRPLADRSRYLEDRHTLMQFDAHRNKPKRKFFGRWL